MEISTTVEPVENEVQPESTESPIPAKPPRLHKYLGAVAKVEGSDLHLRAEVLPRIRVAVTTNAPPVHVGATDR